MVAKVCDFCSKPEPRHVIPCATFTVDDVVPVTEGMVSLNEFLACDICAALVRTNDRVGLLDRARKSLIAHYGSWSLNEEKELQRFYEQFWEHHK